MEYAPLGSISSATHLLSDLIPAYRDALVHLAEKNENATHLSLVADINGKIQKRDDTIESDDEVEDYYETEDATHDLEALTEALESYAPPLSYFGAHEGDGADFGFWVSSDALEEAKQSDEYLFAPELPEVEDLDDEVNYVAQVSDHGNVELYEVVRSDDKVEFKSVWSIV